MRFVVVLFVLTSLAHADTLDTKKAVAQAKECTFAEDLAQLGEIEKAETIGKRLASQIIQLVGKKARAYVVFAHDSCEIVPVVGKPLAFAKGNFGGGATVAYTLRNAKCGNGSSVCATLVSLKSVDDKLLDIMLSPLDCEDGATMAKRALFTGRDSIELGCLTTGGADVGRDDILLDAGKGQLDVLLEWKSGIAWIQLNEDNSPPRCTARVPGGLKIVKTGAKPELDATKPAEPEEAAAAKVEYLSSGCDATVATRRLILGPDGKFVEQPGPPRVQILRKICTCKKK